MPELYGPPMTMPMPRSRNAAGKSQRLLLQQRIAAGQQEEVEIARSGRRWQSCHSLTPAPKALMTPCVAQRQQRLVAAGHELVDLLVHQASDSW